MDMTVVMHDNQIYGLTKKQVSPTSPRGLTSNTTPRGAYLEALDPVTTTLGVANVSFVAQAVDWIPELFFEILALAFHHKGFSFVRVLQRCPEFLPNLFDPWMKDPDKVLLLAHEDGVRPSPSLSRTYRQQESHDPADMDRAREIASSAERIPVGILYRNDAVPCYEDLRRPDRLYTPERIRSAVEAELDRFTVWPTEQGEGRMRE
jgi:2-oxoglutarate ferredoxin oxidoreductase subunit beta